MSLRLRHVVAGRPNCAANPATGLLNVDGKGYIVSFLVQHSSAGTVHRLAQFHEILTHIALGVSILRKCSDGRYQLDPGGNLAVLVRSALLQPRAFFLFI